MKINIYLMEISRQVIVSYRIPRGGVGGGRVQGDALWVCAAVKGMVSKQVSLG